MYKKLYLSDSKEWTALLNQIISIQQDIYFTPEYYSLYEKNGDGEACCFVYQEDHDIVLYPYLVNSVNELGYELNCKYFDIQGAYGYNGIISSSKDASFISCFHNCFDQYCQENNIIAEFSRFHPLLNNQELASPEMKRNYSRNTVKLDLTLSLDEIWMKQFSTKNRNVIRKAEKDGVEIVESTDYDQFLQMYNETMRNVQAEEFYFFPRSYYEEMKQEFGQKLLLLFAMYEGKPISGSLFMFSHDYAHYHLSGRDKNYYKIAANNLVLWHGIQKAKEKGCIWMHLGGGTTGEENDPLLHFKQNFSKDHGEFWIGKRVHNQTVYNEVIQQWKEKYPESYDKNNVKLLGYREIR